MTQYALVHQLTQQADPGAAYWTTFRPLNITLEQPGASIVGYSSMVTQSYGQLLCQTAARTPCGILVQHVTTPVAPTGRSLIDLAGVDQVVVQQQADAMAFAARAGAGWTEGRGPAGEWRFDRIRPLGLVTWASPGAAAVVQSSSPARITAQARNDAPTPATIVLARAWYPGWSASLNGTPLVARPLAGLLLSVQLPPHSAGRLGGDLLAHGPHRRPRPGRRRRAADGFGGVCSAPRSMALVARIGRRSSPTEGPRPPHE